MPRILTGLLVVLATSLAHADSEVRLKVLDGSGKPLPCRIHVTDEAGQPVFAEGVPSWRDHFVCDGTALGVQPRSPLEVSVATELIEKAPGVKLWSDDRMGPSLRDAASSDVALIGRLREDTSVAHGLQFWLAADGLRLAALNAVKLAETRLRLN